MTAEQESQLLKLVENADALAMVGLAVAAVPNVSAGAITKTLTVGGLTTAIAQKDDAIALQNQAHAVATAAHQSVISTLNAEKNALIEQRKSLQA